MIDDYDLQDPICGVWVLDYMINWVSKNLDKIPATAIKTNDGYDFSSFSFTFFENGTLYLRYGEGGYAKGRWWFDGSYRYQITDFGRDFIEASYGRYPETLEIFADTLACHFGFLTFVLKRED